MIVIETVAEMRSWSAKQAQAGKIVGFVPTMGALHAGHGSLIHRAHIDCGAVVVSIFVNPTQFGPNEDFDAYPRTWEEDKSLCKKMGADVIFKPPVKEIYPDGTRTVVEVLGWSDKLCGMTRPGHFRGVATVVTKLFAIVRPHKAFFGAKDGQQLRIIQRMTRDLCLGVDVVRCETVREADGLAMSSRNRYLKPAERKLAPRIYQALKAAQDKFLAGEANALVLTADVMNALMKNNKLEIDYVLAVDLATLEEVEDIEKPAMLAIACYLGKARLIDNVLLALPGWTLPA
ncbi:MAG TPA: pantoate--beta-alanine ligase [Planctomycetota bacterium]|nr:pantoate--beta-alanine ligase [Planctomycetota bacterium]